MSRFDTNTETTADISRPLIGKTALVTGASRGIGRAIALALARDGARVAVHYGKNIGSAERTVSDILRNGGDAFAVQADLADRDGPTALLNRFNAALSTALNSNATTRTQQADGQFDILVNNAGESLRATIEAVDPTAYARLWQVNFHAPFFLIQQALPYLRDGGRIINVSSMGTRVAYPVMSVYAPTKAALESLTSVLASHLGERGITVNAVLPGATATDMNERASDPVLSAAIVKTVALRRIGQPSDVADIVAFLAGPGGRWITGQRIDASGGQQL